MALLMMTICHGNPLHHKCLYVTYTYVFKCFVGSYDPFSWNTHCKCISKVHYWVLWSWGTKECSCIPMWSCVLIQMLSRMQSQLNRMEVKFDKLLSKSRKERLESESPLENQRSPGFSPSPVWAHMSPEPVSPFVVTDTPGSSGIRSYQFWLLLWIRDKG